MSAKHTPGPWRFYTEPQPNGCPIVGNGRGLMLAMLAHSVNYPDQRDEANANARLIAAAPELLDALQWLVDLMPDPELDIDTVQREQVIKAKAVIAKATGGKA